MRCIRLNAPFGLENLVLTEEAEPGAPGAGEILVRLHASSLNYHDYGIAIGAIPTIAGRIPMADGAGVVEAIGDGVTGFAKGDHVVSVFFPDWADGVPVRGDFGSVPGDGEDGYARMLVRRPAHWFTHAPQGWSHAEAATITTAGLTAWRALVVEGRLKAGDVVVTMGTGGVSVYALQIARAMGARVIATSSSDEKLERLRGLGAAEVINYKATPDWGAKVREMTGGAGADHIVEVGGPGTLAQSVEAVALGGHIALIGVLTGLAGVVPTAKLMFRQARLQGIVVGSRRQQMEMVRGVQALGLRPVLDQDFDLAEIAAAFRHEESGRHFGKITLSI